MSNSTHYYNLMLFVSDWSVIIPIAVSPCTSLYNSNFGLRLFQRFVIFLYVRPGRFLTIGNKFSDSMICYSGDQCNEYINKRS